MNLPNNNYSPLPFYTTLSQQNHRKNYAFGEVYPLYCKASELLPFQILRAPSTTAITVFEAVYCDGAVVDILDAVPDSITINKYQYYDIIMYGARSINVKFLKVGRCYLHVKDGAGNEWFSEMLTVATDAFCDKLLRISWSDTQNLYFDGGHYEFNNGFFQNFYYLKTEVGKPDYEFTEEGEQRDLHFFAEKYLSEKIYNFTFSAPEFMTDCIRLIGMCDNVTVVNAPKSDHSDIYRVEHFESKVKWQTQGDFAEVNVQFECDSVVKKIASVNPVYGATTILIEGTDNYKVYSRKYANKLYLLLFSTDDWSLYTQPIDWAKVTPITGRKGYTTIMLELSENFNLYDPRTAQIIFITKNGVTAQIVVEQESVIPECVNDFSFDFSKDFNCNVKPAYLRISTPSIFAPKGTVIDENVDITCNTNWQVGK